MKDSIEGIRPTLQNKVLDRIAPRDQTALYFGAGELRQVGCFLGPVLGGKILQSGGVAWLFFFCFAWLGCSMAALRLSTRIQVRTQARARTIEIQTA